MYYYTCTVGTAEFTRWGGDDRITKRVLARWLRLFWPRFVASSPAGSMAQAINEGWDDRAPEARIARVWVSDVVIPCKGWVTIEQFSADAAGIAEFCRVYQARGRRR